MIVDLAIGTRWSATSAAGSLSSVMMGILSHRIEPSCLTLSILTSLLPLAILTGPLTRPDPIIRVTSFSLSPRYLQILVQNGDRPNRSHSLQTLSTVFSAGSPLKPELYTWIYENIAPVYINNSSGRCSYVLSLVCSNAIRLQVVPIFAAGSLAETLSYRYTLGSFNRQCWEQPSKLGTITAIELSRARVTSS